VPDTKLGDAVSRYWKEGRADSCNWVAIAMDAIGTS